MRVVFMGTPDFAVQSLHALLISTQHQVVGVYTQPDKPVGRKAVLTPSPVKQEALSFGIPVFQPEQIRRQENITQLQVLSPDVIVVAAYGQILPKAILDLPRFGCINVHASLLPAWRGAAPIQWAILAGDTTTGVTIMQMSEGLDTGDMLASQKIEIRQEETGGSLFAVLAQLAGPLLLRTLQKLEEGTCKPIAQPLESTTPYAAMLTRKDGRIEWSKDAVVIERQVRGLDPWPGAYTYWHGKQIKIWGTKLTEVVTGDEPGRIYSTKKGTLLVSCGSGALQITTLQPEGKKRMPAEAWLRGYGSLLTSHSRFTSSCDEN